ncbi:MAG TPA: hypothetical protein PLL69_07690 [Gemmatimonadales bacterium]|nr:hypothetical protein [Gemmatimonadales bacterium]
MFSGTQQLSFDIVSQPVLPSLPTGFRVSGPVLAVTSSQARGSDLMTLRVPVTAASGEQVLLALHDPVRKITEFLPAVYRDATQIVVLTSHLRPDLLTGPGMSAVRQDDPVGWLMPVSYPVPLPAVASVLGAGARWPVLDYGSASMPQGFGAAIPAIQSMAAALGLPLTQLEPGLATPGFYGDGAQLASVTRAAQASADVAQLVGRFVTGSAQAIQQIGGAAGKGVGDELANQLIVASLALNQKPFPVALVSGGGTPGDPVVVTAVSGTPNTVGVLAPAAQAVTSMIRDAGGFVQLALQSVGGGTPVSVDRAIPLTSFVTDFSPVAASVEKLVQVSAMAAGSAARIAATVAMEAEAGLPSVTVDLESIPGGGFAPVTEEPILVRSQEAVIRIPSVGSSAGIMVHQRGGAVTAETGAATLPVKSIGIVQAAADLVETKLVISSVRQLAEGVKQVAARVASVVKVPFEVTPEEADISEPFEKVTFTASVPRPPEGGYGITWEWTGGNLRNFTNTTTADIEFVEVKDYTVVATLYSFVGGIDLAVDTVKVVVNQSQHWRLASFTDQDDLFNDEEGQSPIATQLLRMLAAPTSTMLSVVQMTANSTELQFQTMMTKTWDAEQCCPPTPLESFRTMELGRDPAQVTALGPYFSGWNSSYWSESTEDQNTGTLQAQKILGTMNYTIDGQSQVGPAGALRLNATRLGKTMSGTLSAFIWFVDQDGDLTGPPEEFRFPFTATRLR